MWRLPCLENMGEVRKSQTLSSRGGCFHKTDRCGEKILNDISDHCTDRAGSYAMYVPPRPALGGG